MTTQIEINPEIGRLAQKRAVELGTPLNPELARLIVEEAIINEDPVAGFMIDPDSSYSSKDSLIQAFGVNDVCVNGHHIDVRSVNAEGNISINRALVGTSYLSNGSLVVQMIGALTGRIVGFISHANWQAADSRAGAGEITSMNFQPSEGFNFRETVAGLKDATVQIQSAKPVESIELSKMVSARNELPVSRQREIAEVSFANASVQEKLSEIGRLWSNGAIAKILRAGSVWHGRVRNLADKVAPRFKKLSRQDVENIIVRTGEEFGGQVEAPRFRKSVLSTLAKEELARQKTRAGEAKFSALVDKMFAGSSAVDAVGSFFKNQVAVDLAKTIKEGRKNVEGFIDATAEEIGMAFQQMALQPAYATHSDDEEAGVDAINEALEMLDAGELVETIKELEEELSDS